ncbi:MAG: hypothetical protein ACLPWS_16080, partial [Rhodomicrobium sp.]
MPESTVAAHPALACELATLSVVCLAWRLRSAMAESSSGLLVTASRLVLAKAGMLAGFGEAHEQVPPVVDECDEAGHGPAAGEIAGGEACPAPLLAAHYRTARYLSAGSSVRRRGFRCPPGRDRAERAPEPPL